MTGTKSPLSRAGRNALLAWRRLVALGFRFTGWRIFVSTYCRRQNLLLSVKEIHAVGLRLRLQPGNFLVFGAGNDSLFWATLNRGHATVFLENDLGWLDLVQKQGQDLVLYPVRYTCRLEEMRAPEGVPPPPLDLPDQVRGQLWATILVDAPQGWGDGPGRLQSIFEASRLVAPGGTIFVHDCDREGERYLVGRYLNGFRCTPLTPKLWFFER